MHATPDVIEIDNAFRPSASGATPLACPDDGLSAFLSARPRLFGIAFRMLGSAAEAEDIVQDVWIRWQTTDRRPVCNPLAFLVTATTRLAINVLQSARARREADVGPSLPEPVDNSPDPGLEAERGEALNLAVLLLLERLSPTERTAYVLREAFDCPYRQIADILRVEEANARQLVTRAREHVSGGRRAPVSTAEQRCLLNAFVAAARTGDLARLERLFTSNVASTSEGGGLVRAEAATRSSRRRRQIQRRGRGTRPERRDSRVHAICATGQASARHMVSMLEQIR
jgi:RNA polymerase sigma-70 factor (ECF subfamily)